MNTKLVYTRGDIAKLAVDAIVNTTETSLVGSSHGVDGAIRGAAGDAFSQACCKSISDCGLKGRRLNIGDVISIPASGELKAKYVINTFGPDITMQEEVIRQKLRDCYVKSLDAAQALNLRSIAFPCISTGCHQVGQMPSMCSLTLTDVAKIAVDSVSMTSAKCPSIEAIVFCCHSEECEKSYEDILGLSAFVPYDKLA